MTLLLIPKDESHVSYVIKYLLSCLLSINIIISNSVQYWLCCWVGGWCQTDLNGHVMSADPWRWAGPEPALHQACSCLCGHVMVQVPCLWHSRDRYTLVWYLIWQHLSIGARPIQAQVHTHILFMYCVCTGGYMTFFFCEFPMVTGKCHYQW